MTTVDPESEPSPAATKDEARPEPAPNSTASPSEPAGRDNMAAGHLSRIVQAVRRHRGLLSTVVAIAIYTAVIGWVLFQRYWAFQTYAWDLGNYNQGMFTATFQHRLFYYTADLPSGNVGSLLAAHFSPVLFLLIPFYAVDPGPPALLVIQTAALAGGAIPLYCIARRVGLPEGWSLLTAAAYLLSPVLMGVGWYDFHPEAFLPLTVLLAIYCYYFAGRWTFVAALLLTLTVIETVAPLLFLLAVAALFGLLVRWYRGIASPPGAWERNLVAAVVSPVWVGAALLISELVNHGGLGTLGTGYSAAYSTLGPNLSFIEVVPYALLHPSAAANAIASDGGNKAAYVLVLLGSFAFLPLLGPKRLLLPAVGWMVLVILSNGGSLDKFGDQYAAYAFPFLAAGAAFGLARLRSFWQHHAPSVAEEGTPRRRQRPWSFRRAEVPPAAVALAVVVALLVSSATVSPLLPDPSLNYNGVSHGVPSVTSHDLALHDIIGLIPASAAVLTVSAVFPEVSSRVRAYVVPISSSFVPGLSFQESLDTYINGSSYVLLDYEVDFFSSSVLVRFGNLSGFGLLAEEDQIVLLERGWAGPPLVWVPYKMAWAGGDLQTNGNTFVDYRNSTPYGPALTSTSGPLTPQKGALLWFGPYTYGLVPGEYSATFWVSVTTHNTGDQLGVEVVSNPLFIQLTQQGENSSQHSYGFEFSTGNKTIVGFTNLTNPVAGPVTINEHLTVTFGWGSLEVWSVAGVVDANDTLSHLYAVTLQQLAP